MAIHCARLITYVNCYSFNQMFRKIRRYIKDPYYALGNDMIQKCPHLMSDKYYLSVLWKMIMGYELDWEHPKTFNEKLQWLKLHDRNPLYSTLVDKFRVKQWVADKIGEQHVIPTLAVFNSVDEIDLDKLPDQFVLKCNHDSGSVVICRDKTSFDLEAAKVKLAKALRRNFYWEAREWAYKKVNRLVFAEKYVENVGSIDLLTYKFLCFNGEPHLMYITVKNDSVFENYYDMDGKSLDIRRKFPINKQLKDEVECFEEMKRIARALSENLRLVRLDLYKVGGQVYFSEYTFYDWAGLMNFTPDVWNHRLGELIQLPTDK